MCWLNVTIRYLFICIGIEDVHSDESGLGGDDMIDQSMLALVYLVFGLQDFRGQVLTVHQSCLKGEVCVKRFRLVSKVYCII